MLIKNRADFFSGLLFVAVGGAFAWGATSYDVGQASQMGPGYFPRLIGVLTTLVGLIIAFKAMAFAGEADAGRIGRWAWRPLILIIAANFIFGIALSGIPSIGLPVAGLIVGVFALTFLSALAGEDFDLREVTILATVLAGMAYLVCVTLLSFNLPVWPTLGPSR